MKFPLAVFCACFFLAMMAAVQLPAAAVYAAGGLLAVAFVRSYIKAKKGGKTGLSPAVLALALAAVLGALFWRGLYNRAVLEPVAGLSESRAQVQALVVSARPGYGEETMNATLRVQQVDGLDSPKNFDVQVFSIPAAEVGQKLSLPLRFYSFSTSAARNHAYSRGQRVAASLDGEVQVLGREHTLPTRLRQLQYAAADNILARLPRRLSGPAAAMSVGDRRFLPYEVTLRYREAGLSHLLVVSGLHLSLLAGAVQGGLRRVLPRRGAALGGLGFVILFSLFAGAGPSVLRSGFMWGMIFLGDAVGRKAHPPTSLALAVFLMAVQNPYAVMDVGLLLSASATMGLLFANKAAWRLKGYFAKTGQRFKTAKKLVLASVPTLCATAFTLPVLVWAQMGVSLLSVPANLVALPLVAPIVLSGFVMALPLSVPVLNWLGATAALICGAMLRVLEILCGLCSAVPGAYFPVSGVFALCTVVVVYILVFLGLKTRRLRAFSLAAAGMLALSLALSAALSAGTVQVVVAGRVTPSLVVVKNRQAVVLYRSRTSANAVAQVLWRHRVKECVLLVDMCQTVQSTEYVDLLKPREVVVGQDLLVGGQYTPLPGLDVVLVRQPGGDLACIDVEGYKVGCYTGSVDASPYARLNVLLAGSGTAAGEWDTLLCGSSVPGWAEAAGASGVLRSDGEASLWLRPGKSVIFREVLDGEGS